MLSPSRRVTSSGMIQIEGDTSPILLINPVFTITANNFTPCGNNRNSQRYPKVRQKSKSSGASPQKHPNPNQFHEDFINIITSSESIDYPEVGFYGDDGDYLGIIGGGLSSRSGSNASARSFHSNPYLHSGYGSNSKLLQVPSSSALLFPGQGGYYEDEADDLSPTRNSRQQRSRSITVPIQHQQRSPERCSSEVFIRRCSSASPKGRYSQQQQRQQQFQQQKQKQQKKQQKQSIPGLQQLSPTNQGKQRPRGFSLNAGMISQQLITGGATLQAESNLQTKGKRRRSSGYRRPSNQSMMTAFSSSSSSLGSQHSSNSPTKRKLSPYNRQRTLSMPTCVQNGNHVSSRRNSQKVSDPGCSDGKDESTEEVKGMKGGKAKNACYDVVIIGSPNVGKSTLAEYFNKKGGTSGSDQGIGSEEDESDDCVDEDLTSGKAIVFKPGPDLNQQTQYNFSLRIFNQQISAVSYLYKYDGVMILYSVTDRDSFQFARKALEEIVPLKNVGNNKSTGPINNNKAKKVVILVANKSDLERSRSVSTLEGRSLATAYDCKFIEISSSLDVGIDSLQKGLATQVYLRHHKVLEDQLKAKKGHDLIGSSSLTSSTSSNSSSFFGFGQQKRQQRKKKNSAALSSLKLAQKLIDRIMSIRISSGKSKSCLDLHSL